ncbi:cytochrome c [Zoogloea sp.]|uniref:c-type cytochrome n=1 Tax=Zoogloea sp. TaxID=49181 RepID=UPI0035B122B3
MRLPLHLLFLAALWAAGGATAADRIGDPLAGKAWSDENVCKECHNPDGNSTVAEYPRLGGQQAAYLYKQLRDFRDGRRRNVIMQALTQELGDTELANVAAHFAAQPVMKGAVPSTSALGRSLFEQGDSARGIPACSACHGADGKGGAAGSLAYPAIGGQHRFYLRGQLQDWRSDTRRNSPDGVMNQIAKSLGDKDIEALADYLSGL